MTTVAGFLSIAGAALTTVGALTKNSDLSKIGGYMSIAGGIGTAYSAATAGSAAAETGAQEAANAAWQSGGQAEVAAGANEAAYASWGAGGQAEVAAQAAQTAAEPTIASTITDGFNYEAPSDTLLNTAAERAATAPTTAPTAIPTDIAAPSQLTGTADPVVQGGQRMTTQQVNSFLKTAQDKAAAAAKGLGSFVKDNKELVQLGGGILKSMYGPEAESLNMRQSIYERQRANMNSPVRLGIVKPQ